MDDVSLDGIGHAFFVADGAGGLKNGKLAAERIVCDLNEKLPDLMETWKNAKAARKGLEQIFKIANEAAMGNPDKGDLPGYATLVFFVQLVNGHWALLRVGDAVFLGKDSSGNWTMPIAPYKSCSNSGRRNATNFLGCIDVDRDFCPEYSSGITPFDIFLLASDWVCGPNKEYLVYDSLPYHPEKGSYKPNQELLERLNGMIAKDGTLPPSKKLTGQLWKIQFGRETGFHEVSDDMTLTVGVVRRVN